jgi:hypothetical protein
MVGPDCCQCSSFRSPGRVRGRSHDAGSVTARARARDRFFLWEEGRILLCGARERERTLRPQTRMQRARACAASFVGHRVRRDGVTSLAWACAGGVERAKGRPRGLPFPRLRAQAARAPGEAPDHVCVRVSLRWDVLSCATCAVI